MNATSDGLAQVPGEGRSSLLTCIALTGLSKQRQAALASCYCRTGWLGRGTPAGAEVPGELPAGVEEEVGLGGEGPSCQKGSGVAGETANPAGGAIVRLMQVDVVPEACARGEPYSPTAHARKERGPNGSGVPSTKTTPIARRVRLGVQWPAKCAGVTSDGYAAETPAQPLAPRAPVRL